MNRKQITIAVTAVLVSAAGLAWAFGAFSEDPQLAKVRELRSQLTAASTQSLPPDQRREKWQQLRTEVEQLPPEKQEIARAEMREAFENRMQERMDQFFALPAESRNEWLDREIREMEERRKDFEKRAAERPRDNNADASGNRDGGGNWRNMSSEERNRKRKERLDETTPKQRAQWSEYRRLMRERREVLGLPPLRFGPGRA